MEENTIYFGDAPVKSNPSPVEGGYVLFKGETFYKISNYDKMSPFLMNIVSDSDHWMFISSNGALTAGRKNPDHALFPYCTDDKIHDSQETAGSKTVVLVTSAGKTYLWEPFRTSFQGVYLIQRNIYKNVLGNKLYFEEINRDLELTFRYGWQNSEKLGFVRSAYILNDGSKSAVINILDGVQNILPYGIEERFQNELSTLGDGYKRNELLPDTGLGIYSLSSIPTDKAEPSEALKATTVWSTGLGSNEKLLCSRQLDTFRSGLPVESETDVRAARGAYFLKSGFKLSPGEEQAWYLVAEIEQDVSDVRLLTRLLKSKADKKRLIEEDIKKGSENLKKIAASADGLQLTADELSTSRHISNVLFNLMRGGIFDNNYKIAKADYISFLKTANRSILDEFGDFLKSLPEQIQYYELLSLVSDLKAPRLEKLSYEYLPLTFGRRHGDPSRPWNRFSIEIKNSAGEKILNYQGNWRDVFQNWEALALSFPEYVEGMICKFVNASTRDGYNPYRVMRDGFEWETVDPAVPWSHIGYWGDHQVIYFLKLLELSRSYHPEKLEILLTKDIFAYADVPYRIKSYHDLLKDPHNTIDFDFELNDVIKKRVQDIGTDGKFVRDRNNRIYFVNLIEKILVMVLTKLSNFIPEAGIWMTTQRPEWNDANNALVGYGVSMVTLYYLRRFLVFATSLLQELKTEQIKLSVEIVTMFHQILMTLQDNQAVLNGPITDKQRKAILDKLGQAHSDYRSHIYLKGFSEEKSNVSIGEILGFFNITLKYLEHSIRANRRDDNLYHAYNLMKVKDEKEISVRHLYEMLEGQVAVLSSGYLSPQESLTILNALRKSKLYREDQDSYILYPDRQLPRFIEKNNIGLVQSELLKTMVANGDRQIVVEDVAGELHFNGEIRNARILADILQKLKNSRYRDLVEKESKLVTDIYESVFDHQSFTGRSGTFYKYEGLGCIYWHMVSKLLLAVQETCFTAKKSGAGEDTLKQLRTHYFQIQEGIGVKKSPELYGAFPTDPYSSRA
jgi:hypothetical protein